MCTVYSLVIHTAVVVVGISSLNQTAGQRLHATSRSSARGRRGHDEGRGGTSGQVGSDLGLITQLLILHKGPETNQHSFPHPVPESIKTLSY